MNIKILNKNNVKIAEVLSDEQLITDTQSALDLVMTVNYETGSDRILLDKKNVTDDFFVLSNGLAGEILQKFINYNVKAAFYGDYTHYTSKPLKDFIYESNKGKDFFFVGSREEAIEKLENAR
ncbi:MAG: DUF4180 domain-containing protein [Lachnospiraceae bacterium]|nr:DUF4180 domain-containing protein [Lachnospiraceae bacterium]